MENQFDFKEKITYKIKSDKDKSKIKKVKIFSEEFVKNNESNFKIIYDNNELDLIPFLEISPDKKKIEIFLLQINQITNLSKMFSECLELYSFPKLGKLNTETVTDISELFANITLTNLPDISTWNTSNITNMSGTFKGCSALFSLPNISTWDTSKVNNFNSLFMGCSKLEELPDISSWNTSNVSTMQYMFMGCSSLKKLPEISKWDVKDVKNMKNMFYGCRTISSLPDISIWNTENVINMSWMFYGCKGLNVLPDLNKWNVTSLEHYSFMFHDCKLTLNIPAFCNKGNNNDLIPHSETHNFDKKKLKIYKDFKKDVTETKTETDIQPSDNDYSKNHLCCPECKGIPKIITITNGNLLLACDFCGFSDNVKIAEIINIKSNCNWLKKVYFKCTAHKENIKPFASKYCDACDLFLCEQCVKIHDNEHLLEYIPNLDFTFCEKHFSKVIKYCNNCKKDICNICNKTEHKSHEVIENDKSDKLNLNLLLNYYKALEQGKVSKIRVLEKIQINYGDNLSNKKSELLNMFRKDLKEVEDFKKLGRIIFFSSKKIQDEKYRNEIIDNYLDILYYICDSFDKKSINNFSKLIQTKLDECNIIENNLSEKEEEILKENIKNNFTPIDTLISDFNKKKKFIENNIDCSRILKKHIIIEKNKNPDNYIDIEETLNDLDKVIDGINNNSPEFILSVIGKCASNNGTEIFISKKSSEVFKDIELSSIQSLFSLGTQKKYELHFDFGEKENEEILNDIKKQQEFLQKYKKILSKELNLKEDDFIFKDIHRGSLGASLAVIESTEESDNSINKLEGKNNIKKIEEKPLLEALQISENILDPQGNRSQGWGLNEKRGNEDYIPPTDNWRGYGIKVSGKYDNGNDDWLGYENKKGEFAIAYMGINNFLGESKEMISDLNDYADKIEKKPTSKLFRKDSNKRNKGIFSIFSNYKTCGDGVCLFQDPKTAENSADIINVNGYQIKVILMCRVNPQKIRQPENFEGCWILNPTPDEIRPYRILIKIIPNSPLTDGSSLTIATKPIDYIIDILKNNDFSFYEHKNEYLEKLEKYEEEDKEAKYFWKKAKKFPKDKFAITFYTANFYYWIINTYLRDKTIFENKPEKLEMPLEHLKSYIFCLQESLKKNRNVKDGTVVYRGVKNVKFPKDMGKGSQFYFREFISTSKDVKVADDFAKGKKGTFLIIVIKNNKERNYCFGVKNFSRFATEGEILISAFCRFIITDIKRNEEGNDYANLECLGFVLDDLMKNEK